MQIADESAACVHLAVTHGICEDLRQQVADAVAVIDVERLRSAVRKERHRVGGDLFAPIEQVLGDLWTQIVLNVAAVFMVEHLVGRIHAKDADMFTQARAFKQGMSEEGRLASSRQPGCPGPMRLVAGVPDCAWPMRH